MFIFLKFNVSSRHIFPWCFSFPEGGSVLCKTPKSVYVYVSYVTILRLCWFSRTDKSRINDPAWTPTNDDEGPGWILRAILSSRSNGRGSYPSLSFASLIVTGGRCLPRFDQWRPPVPRRVGELRPPPPTVQTGRNTHIPPLFDCSRRTETFAWMVHSDNFKLIITLRKKQGKS